jgi:glycine hydroxymethyltransferase
MVDKRHAKINMQKKDEILELIKKEEDRQQSTLMLIPSENYTYPEVREAVGSVLMHKYAEGQPNKRYYQGNEIVDQIELLCKERALQAFKLDPKKYHANVQSHSGSIANLAVYNALLEPGDKIMSMFLPDGGHLSHGWELPGKKISFTSKIFDFQFYSVNAKTRVFDYKKIEKQAMLFKPKLIISGGTAYPREIDHKKLSGIAKKVGAYYLADVAHEAGLIAGGANSSPFLYADVVTMTTQKTLRGPRGAIIICKKELGEQVDFALFPGIQGGPHINTISGIAIALEKTKTKEFKNYAKQTVKNAKVLAKELMEAGLDVVSGGTDKHLVLVDLRKSGTNGWIVGNALEVAGIVANRNTVPLETASPYYPSGLRLGTPAITVRGMKEKEVQQIAQWIIQIIDHVKDFKLPSDPKARATFTKAYKEKIAKDKTLLKIGEEVRELCKKFAIK